MDIIELAREMGKQIQQTEEYKNLQTARKASDEDAQLQDLIGKFNLKRMDLSAAMQEEEKDDEKIAKLDKELKELYKTVMANESLSAFNTAKMAMDTIMNKVQMVLTASVNGEDPQTCDVEHSCSGSCSSCGGCH